MSSGGDPCIDAVAGWLGTEWTPRQRVQFETLAAWLATEGVALGGIGPQEAERVWPRHVCDALVFGLGMGDRATLLDVGAGIGLPGLPLAIAFPGVTVTLVERSGRRIDALLRLRQILELPVVIRHDDVAQIVDRYERVVFRASLRLEAAVVHADRLMTAKGGDAWFGLGRGVAPDALLAWRKAPPNRRGVKIDEVLVPTGILDSPVWLLRMTRP